ncbi:trypsin-like peptidase domain-containing protein [Streptomyces yangpuensis]|uniref:trypsin-like peptidase domain-containing protein n=1 Tax=Streptomyces yangpuensis TaxID=1648182 RepID=UPI000AB45381|nr:trypsin-like peptidase domain-containing protein [Streptomyces yangpuensis]
MRRTLTVAAAAAALLVSAGPLPVAEAGGAVPVAAGRWGAHEAESFWTPERMASARPLPPGPPGRRATAPRDAVAPEPPADRQAPVDPWNPPAPGSPVPIAPVAPAPPLPPLRPDEPGGPGEPEEPVRPVDPEPGPDAAPAPSATPTAPTPKPTPPTPTPPTPVTLPAPAPVRPALPRIPAAGPGVGQDFGGLPVVGRMFLVKGGGSYFCTASVVASPGRNLIISAAHCLTGADTQQVAFVPQYTRARPRPFGMFPVLRSAAGRSKIWIDQRYRTQGVNRAAALDVAFAQVGPGPKGFRVQDVVGGNRLVTGAGYAHARATLIGHPSTAARPRLCVNRTTKYTSTDSRIPGSFLRIACTGYPGGTSGGPFLLRLNGRTGTGDVVGVIGGWKTGGDRPDVSYSSYFGADIRKLYEKAVAGAKAP